MLQKPHSFSEKRDVYGIHANNDAAEGNFAVFDDGYNHDYDRQSASYVTGRKSKTKAVPERVELGLFHTIPQKLQESLISMGKSEVESTHKNYLEAIKRQRDRRA